MGTGAWRNSLRGQRKADNALYHEANRCDCLSEKSGAVQGEKPAAARQLPRKALGQTYAARLKKQWADQPDVLLPERAGKHLDYTHLTVHKWIRDGKLNAIPL